MSLTETRDSLVAVGENRILAEPEALAPASSLAVLHAFLGFVLVDAILRIKGYLALRRRLSRCRVRQRHHPVGASEQLAVMAAVDRAAVYYPRRTKCLQRSAVLTWLLRKNGVPAHMVIGCRHTPFYAHAWVDVSGVVVNDRPSVAELYPEMERV